MTNRTAETSPQIYARIGGFLYLIIIGGGIFGELFIRGTLIVPGNATATAANIEALELLWRIGIAAEFFMLACTVALALIFYVLLRPVGKELALLAVFFNLACVAIEATNELNLMATMFPLAQADSLRVFSQEQLHALAYLPLKMYGFGFGAGLIFFGCECLVLGYLIFKAGYLPGTIGVLMAIAGLCYLTNSFALIVAPSFGVRLFPEIMIPVFVGEASLCLWLLVKGVNIPKWKARASADPEPGAFSST